MVNINNEEMGPQKSEVTLRHSQSSEWRSPMKQAYLAKYSTQRQFSPRAVDYRQILHGKYLAKQASSQDSRAFLNSIRGTKDLRPHQQKSLISTTAFNFCSAQKLVVEKHTLSQETLVLQAEPVQSLQDPSLSQHAMMPQISKIDFEESRDKQADETFYKGKGALINHLQRNHNFGGVLKENKLQKKLKAGSRTRPRSASTRSASPSQ